MNSVQIYNIIKFIILPFVFKASNGDDYDELWDAEWFEMPDVPYMVKFKFEEDNYIILATNLREIYGEKVTSFEANARFRVSMLI